MILPGLMLKHAWSHDAGTGPKSARGQESTAVKDAFLPSFHPGLQKLTEDRLSGPNAGQGWPESWTAAGGFSMDAFQFLTSVSGHIAALQRQVAKTHMLTVVRRDGESGIRDRTLLYLGCCDVVPCRITFKFNSSSPQLLRHVNVSRWHIWTCPTGHTCKRSP